MEEFGSGILTGTFLGLLFGALFGFIIMGGNYDNGYCNALGGSRISAGICNVNGKVVEVK